MSHSGEQMKRTATEKGGEIKGTPRRDQGAGGVTAEKLLASVHHGV